MTIFSTIKDYFTGGTTTAQQEQLGTVFLKASEVAHAQEIAESGVTVSIPETGTTYTPTGGGSYTTTTTTGVSNASDLLPTTLSSSAYPGMTFSSMADYYAYEAQQQAEFPVSSTTYPGERFRTMEEMEARGHNMTVEAYRIYKIEEAKRIAEELRLGKIKSEYDLIRQSKQQRERQEQERIADAKKSGTATSLITEGSIEEQLLTTYIPPPITSTGTVFLKASEVAHAQEIAKKENLGTSIQIASSTGEINPLISLPDIPAQTETYQGGSNMFISTSPTGESATGYIRPPTPDEAKVLETAQYKGDLYGAAIVGVPAQMLGGILTKQVTPEEVKKLSGWNILNPVAHYDVFKSSYNAERDLKEAQKISTQIETINTQFETKEKKVAATLTALEKSNVKDGYWVGSEPDLKKYNDLVNTYNKDYGTYAAKYENYSANQAYQRAINSPERKNLYEKIAESKLTPTKKFLAAGVVGATDIGTFFVPAVRVIRGGEMAITGAQDLFIAKTTKEKVKAGIETGIGTALVFSGLGGGAKIIPSKLTGTGTGIFATAAKVTTKAVIPIGVSGYVGYSVLEQTKDIPTALGAGLGTLAGFKAPEIAKGTVKAGEKLIKFEGKLYKDIKGQQQLISIGKFEKLKEFFVKLERELLKVKGNTREETIRKQNKLMEEYKRKYVQTEQGRAKFEEWKKDLIKRDILKLPIVYLEKISLKKEITKDKGFLKEPGLQEGYVKKLKGKRTQQLLMEKPKVVSGKVKELTISKFKTPKIKQALKSGGLLLSTGKAISLIGAATKQATKQESKSLQAVAQTSKQAFQTLQAVAQTSKQAFQTLQAVAQASQPASKQEFKMTPILKSATKQESISELINLFKQRYVQRPEPKRPKDTVRRRPIKFPDPGGLLQRLSKKAGTGELFKVFSKRFGKDIEIGQFKTKQAAGEKLKRYLTGTLARSGKVLKDGKELGLGELNLGGMFRAAKRDKKRIVQKAKFSLGTFGERSEIQYFKRKAGKGKRKSKKSSLFGF